MTACESYSTPCRHCVGSLGLVKTLVLWAGHEGITRNKLIQTGATPCTNSFFSGGGDPTMCCFWERNPGFLSKFVVALRRSWFVGRTNDSWACATRLENEKHRSDLASEVDRAEQAMEDEAAEEIPTAAQQRQDVHTRT